MTDTKLNRREILAASAATGAAITASTAIAAEDTSLDLSGKSILITGCSSGFGYVGAKHYAGLGAKVFATMRNLPRKEAAELEALNNVSVLELDVLSDESVSKAVAKAEKMNGGGLDVLINNAGISTGSPVELQDMEAMRLMFETNVMGLQRVARAVLPGMRAKKSGAIFNLSSQLGRVMVPGMGVYSSTKFAVESMSEQMAYELVSHGIDVTIVQPGGYPTKIWQNANKLTAGLLERADEERKAAYAIFLAAAGRIPSPSTDPLDVPSAISKIIAMAPGKRPLRLPVHPGPKPQAAINGVSAKTQVAMLGETPFGPWVKDVNQRG